MLDELNRQREELHRVQQQLERLFNENTQLRRENQALQRAGLANGPLTAPLPQEEIPAPPEDLVFRVAGHRDIPGFLASGGSCMGYIRDALLAAGVDPASGTKHVLDWGCGCGRIARHWAQYLPYIDLHGCDIDETGIQWCQRNMPFGSFSVSRTAPPLPYPAGHFDIVYGASVLTHLTLPLHYAWMQEIWRLLKPDGVAVLTTMGPSMLPQALLRLSDGNIADREGAGVVTIDEEFFVYIQREQGTNDTATLQTAGAFARVFYPFQVVFYRPRYGLAGIQDTHVVRKKSLLAPVVIESLFDQEISGTRYTANVSIDLSRRRHLIAFVGATNLFSPATVQLSLYLPTLDAPVARSQPVPIPEKTSWTLLKSAYQSVVVEDVPEHGGEATLMLEITSDKPMDGARVYLRNTVLF
jgi:2-polyprenyl-3-methyl-5-hydroxy-6-metoxy-1,4-benzoquinol methylase